MIRNRFGSSPEPVSCGFAAAVADEDRVAILLPERSGDDGNDVKEFGLGAVLIWARAQNRPIVVVAPADRAGALARQAEDFHQLSVAVLDRTSLREAVPETLPDVPQLGPLALGRRDLFESAGAIAVDDFGRLIAEVGGLEIARVDNDGSLQIGVGTADRELHGYVHTHVDPAQALNNAAEMMRSVRRMGAASHPLNRRARQRWLRSHVYAHPDLVGAGILEMVPPLEERILQLGPEPAVAIDPVSNTLFVFSAGVNPEVVPSAADYRRRHNPARTVIVTSAQDAFAANVTIAEAIGIESMSVPAPY